MIDGAELVRIMQERLKEDVLEAKAPKKSRAFIRVRAGASNEAVRHAILEVGLSHLVAITAADAGEELEVNYHLTSGGNAVLTLSARVPKNGGALPTISDVLPNAALYEREAQEMTGIKFEGLKDGSLLILPEGWPKEVHPLTKSQTLEGLSNVKLELDEKKDVK